MPEPHSRLQPAASAAGERSAERRAVHAGELFFYRDEGRTDGPGIFAAQVRSRPSGRSPHQLRALLGLILFNSFTSFSSLLSKLYQRCAYVDWFLW